MNEIYKYLEEIKSFSNKEYNYLISLYDKEMVNKVIISVLRDGDKEIYNKILDYTSDMNDEYKFVNDVFMKYIYELLGNFNELFLLMGFSDDKFSRMFLCDRIEYVINNFNDVELIKKMNNMYSKFIDVRNKILEANLHLVEFISNRFFYVNATNEDIC